MSAASPAHLLEQGRTLPGFIGDIGYAQSNRERYEGFCQALMDAGKNGGFFSLPDDTARH